MNFSLGLDCFKVMFSRNYKIVNCNFKKFQTRKTQLGEPQSLLIKSGGDF